MIEIKYDGREVLDALNDLMHRVDDMTPVMQEIGEYLLYSTKERFATGAAPDGSRWKVTNNPTPLIGESGRLSDELHYEASAHEVVYGSPLVYAAVHQFGAGRGEFGEGRYKTRNGTFPIPWGDIPARPFLGLGEDDREEILDIVRGYLAPGVV